MANSLDERTGELRSLLQSMVELSAVIGTVAHQSDAALRDLRSQVLATARGEEGADIFATNLQAASMHLRGAAGALKVVFDAVERQGFECTPRDAVQVLLVLGASLGALEQLQPRVSE